MKAIYIPQLLKAPRKTVEIQIHDVLPDLKTLTPVRGTLRVAHQQTYLEVSGQAETIVTLICHRCLQNYNYRLSLDTQELIWLEDEQMDKENLLLEREVKVEDLSETLSPRGYFQPDAWLYEQFCLLLPLQQICDSQCEGIIPSPSEDDAPTDSRWATLEALKQQLST